jgi:glycerol uptake facilitator-like aquaporin
MSRAGHTHVRLDDEGVFVLVKAFAMGLTEMFGTAALVFLICIATSLDTLNAIAIGIVAAFVYAGLHNAFRTVTGAHFNPFVTAAVFFSGHMGCGYSFYSMALSAFYIAAQLAGGLVAAAIFNAFGPPSLGLTVPTNLVAGNFWLTVLYEFLAIAVFIAAYLTSVYREVPKKMLALLEGSAPTRGGNKYFIAHAGNSIALGLLYGGLVYGGVLIGTGGALNFARTLGPAVIAGVYSYIGAYLLAGVFGVIGGILVYYIISVAQDFDVWNTHLTGIMRDTAACVQVKH